MPGGSPVVGLGRSDDGGSHLRIWMSHTLMASPPTPPAFSSNVVPTECCMKGSGIGLPARGWPSSPWLLARSAPEVAGPCSNPVRTSCWQRAVA